MEEHGADQLRRASHVCERVSVLRPSNLQPSSSVSGSLTQTPLTAPLSPRRSAAGQLSIGYELGVDEDSSGRGFAPRWLMAAGHLEARAWPKANDVSYMKMWLKRYLTSRGRRSRTSQPLQPGSCEYMNNSVALLLCAGLVYLHVIPAKTVCQLDTQMQIFRAKMEEVQADARVANEGEPGTPSSSAAQSVAEEEMDTPKLYAQLGLSPVKSPEMESLSQSTDDSENDNGKRSMRSGPGSNADARPKVNPPTKEQADERWSLKAKKMYPTSEAQDQIAAFFTHCEDSERLCVRNGSPSLCSYWRKGRTRSALPSRHPRLI